MREGSVWVEPLFAEGKEWQGMRRFRLQWLWRVNCEALLRAAEQNVKSLLRLDGFKLTRLTELNWSMTFPAIS